MSIALAELLVADPPEAWTAAGFAVTDDVCFVGDVGIRLVGPGDRRGIVGWALAGLPDGVDVVDGVPTTSAAAPATGPAEHPNGVVEIDHVVLMSPHLDRTEAALAALGVEPRRRRDGELGGTAVRQVFYRLGATILEVVGSPDAQGEGPASLWGVTFTVADLDASAAHLGDATGRVKDAVQPGRRITTLRHRDLGMSVRIALISPHPGSSRREPGEPAPATRR